MDGHTQPTCEMSPGFKPPTISLLTVCLFSDVLKFKSFLNFNPVLLSLDSYNTYPRKKCHHNTIYPKAMPLLGVYLL